MAREAYHSQPLPVLLPLPLQWSTTSNTIAPNMGGTAYDRGGGVIYYRVLAHYRGWGRLNNVAGRNVPYLERGIWDKGTHAKNQIAGRITPSAVLGIWDKRHPREGSDYRPNNPV